MRLAEDRRGRVPFALVGVVLLVGSAVITANLSGGPEPRTDDSVGTAIDRTTAATNTALRGAVASAGRDAARAPVVEPADTPVGGVLNDSTPYRDALRIRIYLAARSALDGVAVRSGDVRGTASLPATPNESALRTAKRRVEISPAGDSESAGLAVRIENVTVTASRDGRSVERADISPDLTVATPALALHERAERFESRLNRAPLEPGLGRRLTARLYALAWGRGYAQYGGAPIENVVANRHVELATNGAVLREQRETFGSADPGGRGALAWATARTGATDLLAGVHNQRGTRRTKLLKAANERYQGENPMPGGVAADLAEAPETRPVGVNRTADRAFAEFVAGERDPGFDATLRAAYRVETRLVSAVRETESEPRPSLDSPGENWTLEERRVETDARVEDATGPPPDAPAGYHLLAHETRRVQHTHSLVGTWSKGNETRRTVERWTETFVVRVGVAGDHRLGDSSDSGDGAGVASAVTAPPRPVAGVHERAGALDGPNLRDVPETATEELVADRGGFDAVARRAADGTLDVRSHDITGERPADLREWTYRDLAALRERVRNVSVEASPTAAVSDEAPPATHLARELENRRDELVRAPDRYDGAADRARVATRAAYLDRVVARLRDRADRTNDTRAGVGDALADAGVDFDRARRILRERSRPATPPAEPMPADGPGRPANLRVTGGPPYLTLAELDGEHVSAIPDGESRYPLAARNLNVFSVPYGDAADSVASVLDNGGGDSETTDLRTAALALRAANRTLDARANDTLAERRDRLHSEVSASMRAVRRSLVAELAMPRFDLTETERTRAVRAGLARWNTTAGRALAVTNGSAADAVAAEIRDERPPLRRADREDWVRVRTELAFETSRTEAENPTQSAVNETATVARKLARKAAEKALSDAAENASERVKDRWFGEVLSSVPAGLPVAPVPGYWSATLNVWDVSVRGQYERFAVRAPQGSPGASGVGHGSVTYLRENRTVRLDVDGDGATERLGRNERLSFETDTVVVVAVPPGPSGVGDTDGTRDERSPGWKPE
ncbi:DUF7286 family protein [Halorussus amylolyticus]|uniref:DUF7286 family protein n=1 Tax=Halorussus amylolyticus TaxID=1126242 RepID=UPI00104329BD|nr:hypothetical protein [Halorussus amylolyticus]